MISIFKKKTFLKDLLEDFVDIHNHLLPGIDDGAQTVEDAVSMIKRFKEVGVSVFIATPHIMNDVYPNTPETINAALLRLKEELQREGLHEVQIRAAAEYMMDLPFLELMDRGQLLTLKDNFLLVEMYYFQPPINLNEILFQVQTQGYKPLLAHPERYVFFHSKHLEKFEELKTRGCLFQLNLLSVTGHYGANIQEMAFRLLDQGKYDFIGTDTHQQRHLDRLWAAKLPEKRITQLKPLLRNTRETFHIS